MPTLPRIAPLLLGLAAWAAPARAEAPPPAAVRGEFVFERGPTPSCHASTIVEARSGLLAAWFGGAAEGAPDVAIYLARREGDRWGPPAKVADGAQPDGRPLPCWNPVLARPGGGPTLLFYKVGPSPETWWGMMKTSDDDGRTWSAPARLPGGILGPIKNKPLALPDGPLLCPSSTEDDRLGWRVFLERTPDLGRTWEKSGPLNDGTKIGAIQPCFLTHPGGQLQLLCRSRQGRIAESRSPDFGKTWGPMTLTDLPNPNSGIDALTLADGRHLLVHNPTDRGRTPLVASISDDGKVWKAAVELEREPGEYSYPAAIQAADGAVHVTYTWRRSRIRHAVILPGRLPRR